MLPEIVVCAACQTKLKVPEKSAAKALRCPKCKGIVPVTRKPEPKPPPPKEEEFEVNEAAEEEELEVNEAAEEEEFEVNEAEDDDESEDAESPLAKLGFADVKNVFKKADIPDKAREAVEKLFLDNEKPLWAGRPSKEMIESKAWIGLVFGPIVMFIGCGAGIGIPLIPVEGLGRLIFIGFGILAFLVLVLSGLLMIVFRKVLGGNVLACYVVTNHRAYVYDGTKVHAFTPGQLKKMNCVPSGSFEDAGDLIFAYEMNNPDAEGVMMNRDQAQKYAGAKVGFLNIKELQTVREMMHAVLIDPKLKKLKKKKKEKKERRDYFK